MPTGWKLSADSLNFMKKILIVGGILIALSCYARVLQSGWTSTTNPATARTALDVYSTTEVDDAIADANAGDTNGGPKIILNGALGIDDTWSGHSITNLLGGESISQWQLVRVHSDGAWHLADADAAGEFPAVGIAAASVGAGTNLNVVVSGTVRNDSWTWTVGGSIYLSASAGTLTQTAPTTSGHAVQRVGVALSADSAYLNFSGEWGVNE